MKKLFLEIYPILIAVIIAFFLNIVKHHNLLMAVSNSLILYLSWIIFKVNPVQRNNLSKNKILSGLALGSLGFIPLLTFIPGDYLGTIILILSLILFIFYKKLLYIKWLVLLLILTLLIVGNLISANVVKVGTKPPYYAFDKERTVIFLNKEIPPAVDSLKVESRLRYKIATIVYNNFTVFPYYLSARLSQFFSLRNFYDVLLLANLYPICAGMYFYFKNFKEQNKFLLVWLTTSLLIVSINKSQDASSSLYMSLPVLLIFILLGLNKINLRAYFALLAFSLFVLVTPQ